jgi:hypothetical protein
MQTKDPLFNNPRWNHLFSEDSHPCRPIPAGSAHDRTWIPCSKSASRLVWAYSDLMRDLLIHLETNPDVVAVAEYPEETEYWTIATNGEPTVRTHVPAVAARMRDGTVAFIDVMTSDAQKRAHAMVDQRTSDLADHYGRLGAAYLLLDETTIRKQPAFDNRRHMWALRKTRWQDPVIDQLAQKILELGLPLSIAEIARRTDAASNRVGRLDPTGATYSAVSQLVTSGHLVIDLGRRLSDSSVVRRRCERRILPSGRAPVAA